MCVLPVDPSEERVIEAAIEKEAQRRREFAKRAKELTEPMRSADPSGFQLFCIRFSVFIIVFSAVFGLLVRYVHL